MTSKKPTLQDAVSRFGQSAKAKLGNPSAVGAPGDQLRAPFERLLMDMAAFTGCAAETVVAVGETALTELRRRPDYAVTLHGALVGFVEIKAPGKGADPRRLKGAHDKAQWARLQSLPNLLYTDGNEFSLWRDGELAAPLVRLEGRSPMRWHARARRSPRWGRTGVSCSFPPRATSSSPTDTRKR